MTITKMNFKLFGKTETVYRVFDASGELVQVCSTLEEAKVFIG